MNHKIIADETALQNFINWLPDCKENEKYYIVLQARKKYQSDLVGDKYQLKRFATSKDKMFRKIKQLECPLGSYGDEVKDEALVVYVTANPRDMRRATFNSVKELVTMIERHDNWDAHAEVLSCIHRSKGTTNFVHFDVDNQAAAWCYETVVKIVGEAAIIIISTRGGYHLLIQPRLVVSEHKHWYKLVSDALQPDQTGDLMLPVAGCYQGGFVPSFYNPSGKVEVVCK